MIMKLCRGALCRQRRSRGGGQRAKAVLRCHELLFLPFPLASPNPFLFASDLNILTRLLFCSVPAIRFVFQSSCIALGLAAGAPNSDMASHTDRVCGAFYFKRAMHAMPCSGIIPPRGISYLLCFAASHSCFFSFVSTKEQVR
ncbi:uncharacterized protein BO87DRAFT_59496 [Aspergillus neoniger CBS 115656]|uniref:Uncharacterized protein n=1 Tax=Aspergillus neoniger (strain CBS 115656) TaxID=1448310 RepID=A0A318ZCC2_ASPNB|nr:hypothetical protein BO87DRAFT_59496 [Aspergillus neoniger CBS 115656]PYH33952.1 hypothetical protein BO87DRAFT_59496 [Aspergillus neoniger CBS 115656]